MNLKVRRRSEIETKNYPSVKGLSSSWEEFSLALIMADKLNSVSRLETKTVFFFLVDQRRECS